MTASVDSPLTLPAPKASGGAAIVDDDLDKGGLSRLAGSMNTLYEDLRLQLINDGGLPAAGPEWVLVEDTTAVTLLYRPKTLGFSGGEVATETLEVYAFLVLEEGVGGAVDFDVSDGTSTVTYSYSGDITAWVKVGDLAALDNAESLIISAKFSAASNMTAYICRGLQVWYKRARVTLVADRYSETDFHPLHDGSFTAKSNLSARKQHHIHRDAESLYEYRHGGQLAATGYATPVPDTAPVYHVFYVPKGVGSVKLWFQVTDVNGGATADKLDWQILEGGLGGSTQADYGNNTVPFWASHVMTANEQAQGAWYTLKVPRTTAWTNVTVSSVSIYAVNPVR